VTSLIDEKILVTGPAGQIALPLCEHLASQNEVWGIARFSAPGSREQVESLGVTTRRIDLADFDYTDLPDDFTYVLHLAAFIGPGIDYDYAIRVNAEATGALLEHCRRARAALVMSTASVYKPADDPMHRYCETDPLGDSMSTYSPTYAISKIAEEAVARYCARSLRLPITIARMNAAYSANGGLPAYHLDWMIGGQPVVVRNDPCPYSPIHQDDINAQVGALLGAASVPATIVNWGGDDVVGPHDWCAYFEELTGIPAQIVVQEVPGSQRGVAVDVSARTAITGPCAVSFADGFRRLVAERYPDGIQPGHPKSGQSERLLNATATAPDGQ
jgi:nucleoside-diphosphate-sugar epimerase